MADVVENRGGAEEDDCCAICLGRLKWPGARELQCGHVFHLECIHKLIASQRYQHTTTFNCPCC